MSLPGGSAANSCGAVTADSRGIASNSRGVGAANSRGAEPVSVERIVVGRDKIALTVALAPGVPHYMTSDLAAQLVRRVPSLPQHACVNSIGPTFGHVISSTSIPHVLEHLIIDAQCDYSCNFENNPARDYEHDPAPTAPAAPTSASPAPTTHTSASPAPADFLYVGTTEWVDETAGRAHIEVNYADDLDSLRAIRDALSILNGLFEKQW